MKKIHLKYGTVEIELETNDLAADLDTVVKTLERLGNQAAPPTPAAPSKGETQIENLSSVSAQHMNSYVAKLSANTGRKILQAAAYHLTLNDGKDAFSRDDLSARAREAREWKSDYGNQQATNIARMVKAGEIIERASGVYTVPQKQLDQAMQALNS